VRQASPANLSTRRHPETAQAFAKRRPANEGSLYSHPANKIQFLSSRAKRGICSPQYQKTRVPHISRFSRCGFGKPVPQTPQPAAILRKRRPSQREGLPTKDLCTPTPQTKSNSCHPEQSEGSAVLGTRKPGCPHLAIFEMRVRQANPANPSTRRHPEEAQAFANAKACQRRISVFPPRKQNPILVIPSKARDLQSSVSENPRAPHLAPFEMWLPASQSRKPLNPPSS